jgi:hypothetical protein
MRGEYKHGKRLTDVGVVDLGEKPDLRRGHRIVFGKEKLEPEDSA